MPDVLSNLQGFSPNVSGDNFLMILALSALAQERTSRTDFGVTLVFTVTLTRGGAVGQNLILRTEVGIEVIVVNKFFRSKFPFLPPWSGVAEYWRAVLLEQKICNGWGFIASVSD